MSVPIRNSATNRNYMQHFIKISRLEKDTSFVFSIAFFKIYFGEMQCRKKKVILKEL